VKIFKRLSAFILAALVAAAPAICRADVTLALNTSFVKKVKDKATISTNLFVDVHPNKPHTIGSGADDGDIHMAGRDTVVKLPLVAEIMNASLMDAALQLLAQASGTKSIPVTGVWRVWFEHLGKKDQIQGQPVPVPSDSNPDHLFEIHPITSFDGVDVLKSFVEIKSKTKTFEAHPAATAFASYEAQKITISASNTAIMIKGGEIGFNYTEFVIELAGKPKDVGDGLLALARVYDKGDLEKQVADDLRRMVFVKGTPAADELLKHKKGDMLRVIGLPRVNLSEVFAIAAKHGKNPVEAKLPYEMIIAAVLPPTE
jgi:hypothetical protein